MNRKQGTETAWSERLGAFDLVKDFGAAAPKSMPEDVWDAPPVTPTVGEHPRLFFKKADIPDILRALKEREAIGKRFLCAADAEINDGILPLATIQTNGVYNNDGRVLSAIQAKALSYQLTGDADRGYAAILAMKNYLKTFGLGYLNSDQCRMFGYVAYIAACVYDWCYDLMTEQDKTALRVGVENKLFIGDAGCDYLTPEGTVAYCDGNTVPGGPPAQGRKGKMEIGFPPEHPGALFGHNSEYQLLRDYMSFAIAIYDEDPTWWQYCGGRFYQQYYPARKFFYSEEAAIYPEGTACYGPWRFVCDMYATWMLYTITGEIPYGEGLRQVPYSFLAHETHDLDMFATADGITQRLRERTGNGALMTAYLFRDPVLYRNAAYVGTALNPSETLILWSHATEEADTADRLKEFSPVHTNGGYYGQRIVRRSWRDADTPVVLMKGAGRINGGHDHNDFGSFQIYYKGFLTAEDGLYDSWGSPHHFYYHAATVAHNCMLVYRPDFAPHSYYNGGQRHIMSAKPNARQNLEEWLDERYEMGRVRAEAIGYREGGEVLSYMYYENDLTKAYYPETVCAYRRGMLTVFPAWEDVPLLMLVHDDIEATDPSYQKTFLLQCTREPALDEAAGTVTVTNGGGRLVLKSLMGGDRMTAHGGEDGEAPERFYLSGIEKNLPAKKGGNNTTAWGHVEICPRVGCARDQLLQLLYVTDAASSLTLLTEPIACEGAVGVRVRDMAFLFAKEVDCRELSFELSGEGTCTLYLCGLAAGKHRILANGLPIREETVKDGEHMLRLELPSGAVQVVLMDE